MPGQGGGLMGTVSLAEQTSRAPPPPARALAGVHPWATVGATALESRLVTRRPRKSHC